MAIPDFQTIMLPLLDDDVGVTTEDSYVVKRIDSDYFIEE